MATDPLSQTAAGDFAASKLPSLLRALADPEGKSEISAEGAASIKQVRQILPAIGGPIHPRGSDDR